jgi:hypothetical protein
MHFRLTYRFLVRLFVFGVIMSVLAFVMAYPYITASATVREVVGFYSANLWPAGFSEITTLFILPAFLVYGFIQLLPSRGDDSIYVKLSRPTLFLGLLSALWLTLFTGNEPGIALAVYVLMWINAFVLFRLAHHAVILGDRNLWIRLPFCMLSAWLSVFLPVHLMVYFRYLGWTPGSDLLLTVFFLLYLVTTALVVAQRTGSLVFPLMIAYGIYALEFTEGHPVLQLLAYGASLTVVVSSVWIASHTKFSGISRPGRPIH